MLVGRDRRVQAHRQHRAADREEPRVHRRRQRADGAGRQGRLHRQPARRDDRREPAAPGAQDRADRRERAAADRHSRRRALHGRHPHAQLLVRRAQFERRVRAQRGRPVVVRGLRALREPEGDAAAAAGCAAQPLSAVHHAARRTQPVPRLHVQPRQAAGRDAGAPRRPARRPLREHGLGLFVGREAHGEDALREPLAAGEEGSGGRAVRAEGADRVLRRPHGAGEIPGRGARRHPRVEQGVRADRLQGRHRREAAGRRGDRRHLRRAPLDGALVRRRPTRGSRSARRRSTRAPARS